MLRAQQAIKRFATIRVRPLRLSLAWADDRLAGMALSWLGEETGPGVEADPPVLAQTQALARALDRYLGGAQADWPELALDLEAMTPFNQLVLHTLVREVGWGKTTTYGELAALAGRPGAARAVGRAMATNRWPLIVPCHRVVGAGGRLTGFGPGLDMKDYLLRLEGSRPAQPALTRPRATIGGALPG